MTSNVISFEATERDFSVNPRKLRREGKIPATVYGRNETPISVEVDKKLFTRAYFNQNLHLVSLVRKEGKLSALVKNVQVDPRTYEIMNIEFLQVKDNVKVTLSIPIVLENESPAVKRGGVLLQLLDELEIECFPKDIPDSIVIDISVVEELETTIVVENIQFPNGVVCTLPPETSVVKVASPTTTIETTETEAAPVEKEA